jgi:hypothetical protein
MKTRQLADWVTTGLTAFVLLSGGVAGRGRPSFVMEGMTHVGYPAYFVSILGLWKVLGGVAVLAPRFPRLKEWAYAGMLFDLPGAAASHAAVGDPAGKIAAPLIISGIVMASWALRPESRKLRDAPGSPIALFRPTRPEARLETST